MLKGPSPSDPNKAMTERMYDNWVVQKARNMWMPGAKPEDFDHWLPRWTWFFTCGVDMPGTERNTWSNKQTETTKSNNK